MIFATPSDTPIRLSSFVISKRNTKSHQRSTENNYGILNSGNHYIYNTRLLLLRLINFYFQLSYNKLQTRPFQLHHHTEILKFSVSCGKILKTTECARKVIVQINKAMPFSYGDALIHVSKIDAAVEVDDPLVEVPTAVPTEIDSAIGRHIAEMIPDGATLQIGVGGIPNAVLAALKDHQHLGLHTEAMTDGVLPLLESGVGVTLCGRNESLLQLIIGGFLTDKQKRSYADTADDGNQKRNPERCYNFK